MHKEELLPVFNIERFAIHDGPGIRTTVFLQGCQLHCQWCANPESQCVGKHLLFLKKKCQRCGRCAANCPHNAITIQEESAWIDRKKCMLCGTCEKTCLNQAMQISGQTMTPEEIHDMIIRDQAYYEQTGGGITFSGGEALIHIEALRPLLEQCRREKLAVAFETCGHFPWKNIEKAMEFTDLFLFDVKTMNREKMKKYTGGNLDTVLQNFQRIAQQVPQKLHARVPVIPEFNDTKEDMEEIFRFVSDNRVQNLDLLPYHTLGMIKYEELGVPYPFSYTKSLKKEDVIPYQKMAETYGLQVKIGG